MNTYVCIASGASLTDDDVEVVRKAHEVGKCKVIAINDNYLKAPWADFLYYSDHQWEGWHKDKPAFISFIGMKVSCDWRSQHMNLKLLRGEREGFSTNPYVINHGSNSGYQALGLAYHLGAKRIILLGYDMKFADDGKKHWFGNHPNRTPNHEHIFERRMIPCFEDLAKKLHFYDIDILNATRDTALGCFDKVDLKEVLDVK